jgi:hypothetical protein
VGSAHLQNQATFEIISSGANRTFASLSFHKEFFTTKSTKNTKKQLIRVSLRALRVLRG